MIISRSILVAANGSISFFYIYLYFSLSIYPSVGTWVACMSWLSLIVLLWTLGCMYLFKLEFSFFFQTCTQKCNFWVIWCVCAKLLQSCPTLCNAIDCSPPGSSVHGIFQARKLEWVAISFLQGIFPTQGSNLGLLHCIQILYHWVVWRVLTILMFLR